MAKDPAFLFYPGDWLGGTMGMTIEQKGAYMELLIFQFNNGGFTEAQAKQVLSICSANVWDNIRHKFVCEDNQYFNFRLKNEILKRKAFSESRRSNALHSKKKTKGKKKAYAQHMEDENENRNKDINQNTIFIRCRNFYFEWYEKRFRIKPDFDGSDGKALKEIISYFNIQPSNSGDEKVYLTWTTMLTNFDKWEKFHQGQTRLRQINSNKSNIINTLKNGKAGTITATGYTDALEKRFKEKSGTSTL